MHDRVTALRLVRDAIGEVNRTMDPGKALGLDESTALVGDSTGLDSLALVNLIVAVDTRVFETCGIELGLIETMDMDAVHSPLRTVATLVDFVAERI